MRKFSLMLVAGVAASVAAIQIASAADLPRKAPAYVPPAPPPFTWTGFYGGIHAGYGWSDSHANIAVAPAGLIDPASLDQNGSGVIGGGQIGYNWQFAPSWVIGIEGDVSGTGIRKTTFGPLTAGGAPFGVGFTNTAERDIRWLATVRGRLGYAANNWLFYVTGGGAWGEADYTAGPTFAGLFNPITFSHNSSGWVAGGGVEYGFTNNWSARVEYLYYDLGSVTSTNASTGAAFVSTQAWDRNKINVVRAGVNYKFW
jgi:outer membrane immunogenic protein